MHIYSVYFRISLKRGQTPSAKIQVGQIQIQGGQPHIKDMEGQLLRGACPPEINPDLCDSCELHTCVATTGKEHIISYTWLNTLFFF